MTQSWSKSDDFKHHFHQALRNAGKSAELEAKSIIYSLLLLTIPFASMFQFACDLGSAFISKGNTRMKQKRIYRKPWQHSDACTGPKVALSRQVRFFPSITFFFGKIITVHTALGLVYLDQDSRRDASSQLTLAGDILDSALLDKKNPCFADCQSFFFSIQIIIFFSSVDKRALGLLRMKEKYFSDAAKQLRAALTVYNGLFKGNHPIISIGIIINNTN